MIPEWKSKDKPPSSGHAYLTDEGGRIFAIWVKEVALARNRDLLLAIAAQDEVLGQIGKLLWQGYRVSQNKLNDWGGYVIMF